MAVCFASSIIFPAQAVLASTISQKYDSETNFTFDFSKLKISIEKISQNQYSMSYTQQNGEMVRYDVINNEIGETIILLNDVEMYRIPIKQDTINLGLGGGATTTESTTDYWWDGIKYVSGQYIAYPHADRDYYGISPFSSWAATGYQLYHNQIDWTTSSVLAGGGAAVVGAFIGAILGMAIGGPYGSVVGAVVGAVVTAAMVAFGYMVLLDESDCIWWEVGAFFVQWLYYNAAYIYLLSIMNPAGAMGLVGSVFAISGYLRVGSATIYDGIGAGNP